jgi:hypothetical protein
MNKISLAIGKVLFLSLVLLLGLSACGKSINSLEAERDVQGLITILEDSNKDGYSRKDAALALGEIGDPAAVEPLIRYLQECAETLGNPSSNDEWQACFDARKPVSEILGKMGDARVVEPLIEMLDAEEVHDEAVQALGMLNDPRAILPLIDTLDHATNQFTDIAERWGDLHPIVLNLAANASPETFESLQNALPGFLAEEGCDKYRLGLDTLIATHDPRIEAVLLSELKAWDEDCGQYLPDMIVEFYEYDPVKLLPLIKAGYPSDFAQIYYSLTPKPKPMEVDFGSIDDYAKGTQVTITGRLSTPFAVGCDPDCNVNLLNPSNDAEKIEILLHVPSQMQPLPNMYDEEDLGVRMDNGEWAKHQSLVRITGTICPEYPLSMVICDITKIEPVK